MAPIFEDGSAPARLTERIWEMEQCSSAISSVAGRGGRERILSAVAKRPDFEWLMIDATHCKVHPHASGAIGGNESMGRTKGGSIQKFIWPWMRLVCRSEPLKVQRKYDKNLYKKHHLVENAFLRLKRSWRGIATRYVKRLSSFVAFVHLACAMDWLKFITLTRVDGR